MSDSDQSELACSFCAKHQSEVELLIAKPGACICNECVDKFDSILKDASGGEETERYRNCTFCSFMTEFENDLPPFLKQFVTEPGPECKLGKRLIRGMSVSICDECIELCKEIIVEERLEKLEGGTLIE